MVHQNQQLFDLSVWRRALARYGAVTHLTVTLYDADERIICCEPTVSNSLFAVFREHGFAPHILLECARQCLSQGTERPAVVVTPSYGLAVVGTSLVLEDRVIGAAVAGFALVDFCQSTAIASLARQAGVPFRRLWQVAQQIQPIPQRRLVFEGELLQILGDTILREHQRTQQLELAAAQLKAEAAAKDEFFAVLSHELRTPLTPILGWARILKDAHNSNSCSTAAEAIERNALLEIRLVDDLLDLNRAAQDKIVLHTATHDLSNILEAALDTIAASATIRHITVDSVECDGPLLVIGDPVRLQQVFVNILSNAVKFTSPDGQVHVTSESEPGFAVVQVADTGEGIPQEFLPHAFEMFRQHEQGTRRQHEGLGIGLALVKRLVDMHGGHADIASDGSGHGTTVTIRLPLAAAPVPTREERSSEFLTTPLARLRVLVIEDTEDNRKVTRRLLEVMGATVFVARNGIEALDAMSRNEPDVVLCDLRMPQMDGFEFLQELHRRRGAAHPPVVAVTGLVGEAIRKRTEAAGFEGYLSKPFDDDSLTSAIQATMAHRRQ